MSVEFIALPLRSGYQEKILVTPAWWGWLDRDEDRCSCSYDFIEVHPVWENGWFRLGIAVLGICLFWFF